MIKINFVDVLKFNKQLHFVSWLSPHEEFVIGHPCSVNIISALKAQLPFFPHNLPKWHMSLASSCCVRRPECTTQTSVNQTPEVILLPAKFESGSTHPEIVTSICTVHF